MAASREDIQGWLQRGQQKKATHVIVVCDTYDHEDYPVFVTAEQDVNVIAEQYSGKNMQRVMEVYSLTGKYTIESQMQEHRAFHYD